MSNSSIKRYPCPSCGAQLLFNPQQGQLKCDYCGWEEGIPDSEEQIEERSYEQYLNTNNTRFATLSTTAVDVTCDNCSAAITFEPPKVAGECPFCGSNIVAQPKAADPVLAPEGIIPFTLGRKDARAHLNNWIRKLWFAPNALKQLAQPEKLQGIYLPFWTYDAYTTSQYRGERGDYYYTTETYSATNDSGKRVTKTRQVRHTRWSSASGRLERFFDDVLIPATKLVNKERLNALKPWHLGKYLQSYEPSYLAGFEAQRSQITLQEGFEEAKNIMAQKIRSDAKRDIGGDEQKVHHISTTHHAITFKHILLPVWLTSYRYHNKQYQVMINARTGEVQGERPYSSWKIAFAVISVVAVIVGIFGLTR